MYQLSKDNEFDLSDLMLAKLNHYTWGEAVDSNLSPNPRRRKEKYWTADVTLQLRYN